MARRTQSIQPHSTIAGRASTFERRGINKVCKQLRLIALCVATLAGTSAGAVEQPTTPSGYYALGEQFGQCAAFFSFVSRQSAKDGRQDNAESLAQRRVNWRLASVVFLGFGRAKDPESAAQSVEDAEVNKLQARFDAGSSTTINDMIADHKQHCDPLESLRDAAVQALKNSVRPAP
jgi:hypothetical protein